MLFIDSPRVSNQIDVVNRFLLSRAHLKSGSKVLVDQLKVFGKPTKTEERLWITRAIVL